MCRSSGVEGDHMREKKLTESEAREFDRDQLRQEKEDQGLQPYHRHPHYPFVLMLPLIEARTPALIHLWNTRSPSTG